VLPNPLASRPARSASEKFAGVFKADRTTNLITRLQYNVIRTGLRRINLAYSRISLKVRPEHRQKLDTEAFAQRGSLCIYPTQCCSSRHASNAYSCCVVYTAHGACCTGLHHRVCTST
jgi:hypothetical protein